MECWAAPPEMWSKAQAMALGKKLLPPKLRTVKPKPQLPDEADEGYVWADGTRLLLLKAGEKYIQVEVRTKSYTGPGC